MILSEEKDTEKMFIRKYKADGAEEKLEINLPKLEMPFTSENSKYYVNISKLLDISILVKNLLEEYQRKMLLIITIGGI